MSFWFDSWMDDGPLCSKVDYVNISDSHLRVKYVCIEGVWQLRNLYMPIPDVVKQSLSNVVIDVEEGVKDVRIWNPSTTGIYEAKSGYRWLLNNNCDLGPDVGY